MGTESGRLVFTIEVDTETGRAAISDTEKRINSLTKSATTGTEKMSKSFSGTWQSMAKGALAAGAAAFSIQKVAQFLGDSVREAAEADKVHRQLESVFRSNGESAKVLGGIYDEWGDQMEAMTGTSGDTIKSLAALGTHLGIHREQLKGAIQGAVGLTTAYGTSMQSNLEAVAKAYQGQWGQAERLIPQLKGISNESDKLALLQKKMAEGFTATTDAMKGQAGYISTVKSQWGEFKEAVGNALLTVFGGLKKVTDELTGHAALMRRMKADQDAYTAAMERAAKTRTTYASIIADEAIKEREANEILAGAATIRAEIAEIIRKDKAEAVANAQAEALRRLQEEERKAAAFREQYGNATIGLTKAGRDLILQLMTLAGYLPEFTEDTQRAAEEQEALAERIRELIDAEGELTAVGRGAYIGMLQWAGLLPKLDSETEQNAETTQKWSVNWKDANEVLQFAQSMVAGLTDLLGALGIELGASGEAALQAASGFGQLASGIISKNPLQILQGITQALGGLVKLFKGDGVGEAIARENEWMDLTKQQVEQIKELEKQYGSTHAATSELLDQFISSADITADSFDLWADRVHGILSDLDQGKMSMGEVQAQMGDAFESLITKARELGTEGSASIISMFEDLESRGIQVAEVNAYIAEQLGRGFEGYKNMKAAIEESQDAQEAFGSLSIGIFEEMLSYEKKVGENQELVNSITGATQALEGLSNAQRLTEDQYDQFGAAAVTAYDKLIDQGFTSTESLKTMGPYLQRLQMLHEQYGYTIDGNTQKIIDQAKQEGIVIENKKSETREIIDLLSGIAKALGAEIPGALDKTAKAATSAFEKARREAGAFDETLDRLSQERTFTVKTKGQGDYVSAASGFYSPALPQDTVIQAHRGEEVSVIPAGDASSPGRVTHLNITISSPVNEFTVADALTQAWRNNTRNVRSALEG